LFILEKERKGGELMGSVIIFIVLIASAVLNLLSGNIVIALMAFFLAIFMSGD